MNRKRALFLLILILLMGFCLRIYNLGAHSFWYDEAVSIIGAKSINLSYMINYWLYFTDPPLFYLLLRFWTYLGESEFILRLLPLIFGILSIISIYLIGQRLFDKKVGLISAFILAISPFHLYYSQELRTHALTTFLALMSVYYLIKVFGEDKRSSWLGLIVFTTLCIYSHHIALFLIIAQNFFFFLFYKKHRIQLQRWLMSQFTIFLLYLPFLNILIKQIIRAETSNISFWLPEPSLSTFIQLFRIFNAGYNATTPVHYFAILLFFLLFLLGVYCGRKEKEKTFLLLSWLFIPIIMVMILSLAIMPLFLFRTLIYISPAYYIVIAYGLSKIKRRAIYFSLLSVLIMLSTLSFKNYYQSVFPFPVYPYRPGVFVRKENRLAAEYIQKRFQEGDIVVHTCRSTLAPFIYYHIYYHNNKLENRWVVLSGNVDWAHWSKHFHDFPPTNTQNQQSVTEMIAEQFRAIEIRQLLVKNRERIWLVLSSWEAEKVDELPKMIKQYLDNHIMVDSKEFVGMEIYLYQIKPKNYLLDN